jgi:hypothetical protein
MVSQCLHSKILLWVCDYAQNCLFYLLWNWCPQIICIRLYCCNGRKRYYHIQKPSLFTFTKGLKELSERLHSNSCKDVCMESTGKYWIPVCNILEHTCEIVLAHPKYVKAIRGKKPTRRVPNGLQTFSSTTLSQGALSHLLIFASFVT